MALYDYYIAAIDALCQGLAQNASDETLEVGGEEAIRCIYHLARNSVDLVVNANTCGSRKMRIVDDQCLGGIIHEFSENASPSGLAFLAEVAFKVPEFGAGILRYYQLHSLPEDEATHVLNHRDIAYLEKLIDLCDLIARQRGDEEGEQSAVA